MSTHKFKYSVYLEMHTSCRNKTTEMTAMKSVYCEVKRLSRDREIHISCKMHIDVFQL